ncbi:hypothetical protein Tco_1212616 [Tanacetum coccineum]
MSKVKKTDHSAIALASIKSQVPTVIDKYLGIKLDDALLRILERHTADLIEKYSMLPGPESIKNQESKKSLKDIIRIKREQERYLQTHAKDRTANKNPANYHLYHALIEELIADEDAMDKEVKDKVKDHKRKHDSDDDEDDDDDDKGPSAGSNQEHPTLTSTGWQITNTRDAVDWKNEQKREKKKLEITKRKRKLNKKKKGWKEEKKKKK